MELFVNIVIVSLQSDMSVKTFRLCCRKLYWTDSHFASLHVVELDGRYQKKLLSESFTDGEDTIVISRPRAVAVNPKHGY